MLKKTLFIIDKDIKYIEKIKTKIKTSSLFKVIGEATENEEALRKIKVLGGVDFLIIDLNIKGEKDLSLIKKIRNKNNQYNVDKIIVTSEVIKNEIFSSINSLNIDYFFLKPYESKSLLNIIKRDEGTIRMFGLDNIKDEKGIKKLGYITLKPLFSHAHKKAARIYPQVEEIISEYISEQSALENENCAELDRAADPTAKALSALLQLCSEDLTQKRVLDRLGYCLGRYIYILDAACDLPEDIKSGSYNCLKASVEGEPQKYAKDRATPQLYFCANEAGRAFELLDIKKYRTILGNIIYLGLEDTFKKELNV